MPHAQAVRRILALTALTVALLLLLQVPSASARGGHSRVFFNLGFVFGPPAYYYPPPVYYAPPVYYYPPPVYYAPPPAIAYAQPAPVAAQPTSPPYTRNGQTCREYQSTAIIGGRPQPSYGTACLQPDGSWRIVN
jgi:hypothetical protein